MPEPGAKAEEVFTRFGLRSSGLWRIAGVPPQNGAIKTGQRLRKAFEELGGLYGAFAQFLAWRADLLGADYLAGLRQVRIPPSPVSRESVVALLKSELGPESEALAKDLEPEAVWTTLSRTAYCSWYDGGPIVIQVANPPVLESELAEFEASIRFLNHPDAERITAPDVLDQFRTWTRQAETIAQERRYLDALARHKGETLTDYPVVIPEISTADFLCWPWAEGESVADLIRRGSVDIVIKLATAVLEQICNLAIIDADLELESLVLSRDRRLVVRRIGKPLALPAPYVNTGMKYIAAVLAGDAAIVVQNLVLMAMGRSSEKIERTLLNQMSGVEPELKVHLWYPGSASAFESNWRALEKTGIARPLYLNCLHRNLIAVGYWNADAVSGGASALDALAEAHWPVLERVLRTQFSRLLTPSAATEWTTGAGLVMFGAMREMNRIAEELRDDQLNAPADPADSGASGRLPRKSARRIALAALLLVTLLVSARWGATLPAPESTLLQIVALCAIAGLFWVVATIR